MELKRAYFAGSWYPGTLSACEKEIRDFMKSADNRSVPQREFMAGIVPHAGWYFSGMPACQVIKTLKGNDSPGVIVIFGKHLRPKDPATVMVGGGFETPLGAISIHEEFAKTLAGSLNIRTERVTTAQPENTIELQLPFIRYFFPDVPVVAVGVPPSPIASEIGRECVAISQKLGISMKAVGSTDLTHYGPNYGFTPQGIGDAGVAWVKNVNDKTIISRMIGMDEEDILKEALTSYNACCGGAAVAAVAAGKAMGAEKGELLSYTTSYDKSPGESFVGYAGIVF